MQLLPKAFLLTFLLLAQLPRCICLYLAAEEGRKFILLQPALVGFGCTMHPAKPIKMLKPPRRQGLFVLL
jgi:hypothetical protein